MPKTGWGARPITSKGSELETAIRETGCNVHLTGKPIYLHSYTDKFPNLTNFFISTKTSPNFISKKGN